MGILVTFDGKKSNLEFEDSKEVWSYNINIKKY
jgi:hypothetical protein